MECTFRLYALEFSKFFTGCTVIDSLTQSMRDSSKSKQDDQRSRFDFWLISLTIHRTIYVFKFFESNRLFAYDREVIEKCVQLMF